MWVKSAGLPGLSAKECPRCNPVTLECTNITDPGHFQVKTTGIDLIDGNRVDKSWSAFAFPYRLNHRINNGPVIVMCASWCPHTWYC